MLQWCKLNNAKNRTTYNYPNSFSVTVFGISGSPNNHPFVTYNDGQVYFLDVSLISFQLQAAFKISSPIVFCIAMGI